MRGDGRAREGRWALTAAALCLALGQGCAVHGSALVQNQGEGTTLLSPEGKTWRLTPNPASEGLRHMDGQLVVLDGRVAFGHIVLSTWTTREGVHGLQAWLGELERKGSQLGLVDRNARNWYFVGHASEASLTPYVGQLVLLEGYVDGPNVVQVEYFRVLSGPDSYGP